MKTARISKITCPKLTGAIQRDRLFHLLDKARQKPVVWVEAQAGSGKTTLVSSWLDSRKLNNLWYQLDEGDADIASFFYYMGLAAKNAAPRYKKALPILTPEYLQGIPVFTRRFFEELCQRLLSPSPIKNGNEYVIVLDNYQDVALSSGIHDLMTHGLGAIPEGITFVILSRAPPPPQLARLQANNRLHIIGWKDIRFTREESLGLLETQGHGSTSAEALEILHDKTEGWAAGLILLAGAGISASATASSSNLTPDKLFDYFANEIFNKTDADIQDVLLKTSFLQKIDPALAENLSGNAKAIQILERMSRNHYFTHKYGQAYQYHPLFREFLQMRAVNTFSQAELSLIQRKTAELLTESGQIEDAARLCRDSKDWDGLVSLISSQAQALVTQGRSKTVAEWIAGVPGEILKNKPWLLYWSGISRMAYNPTEARRYLETAFPLFENKNDISGLFLSWSSIIDTFVYEWRDFRHADHWITVAEKLIADHPQYPSPEIEARVVSGMFSALYWRQPQHPDLPKWAEKLHHIVLGVDSFYMRFVLGNNLFQYYLWLGDFAKATLLFDVMHKASSSSNNDPLALQWWWCLKAMYSWFAGDHETCLSAISDGVKLGEKSGVHLLDLFLFAQGIYSGLTLDQPEFAEELLDKIACLTTTRTIDQSLYHHMACSVKWYRGNFSEAVEHGKQAVRFSEEAGSPFTEVLCRLELAITLFDTGRHKEAEDELAQSLEIARGLTHIEFVCRIFGAWFAMQQGQEESGLKSLRAALAIGARQNYINFSRWQPQMMSRLCAKALEHGIEVEYIQELIKIRGLLPPDGAIENWPYPVRIHTLGRFELLKDGKPFISAGKVQKKPIELLKILISLGGKNIAEDQIIDVLWPDSEGDAGYSSLKTTILRLRQMLGSDEAVLVCGGEITLDSRHCYVDAFNFMKLLQDADRELQNIQPKNIEAQASLAKKVFNLYRGRFLPADTNSAWAVSLRERLQNKFLQFNLKYGKALEVQGHWHEAIDCYQRALEVDDLYEEFYRQIMFCHLQLGQQAEAVSTYQRCKKIFSSTLGIPLSDMTESLYQAALQRKI